MKHLEILSALKWFYEYELELFRLENKEEKTDKKNLRYLQLKSKMGSALQILQKGLVKPCEEIIELMKIRLKDLLQSLKERDEDLIKRGKVELVNQYKLNKTAGWNHIAFLQKAIPRMKEHLKRLKKATTLSEKTIAVDLIVNELHWGYPMLKHITQHICTILNMNYEKQNEFLILAKEIAELRNQLLEKKGKR